MDLTMLKQPSVITGAVATVAFGSGAALAWWLTERHVSAKYEEIIAEEVQAAKMFYSRLYKKDEFETVEDAAEALLPEEDRERINHEIEISKTAAHAILRYSGQTDTPVTEPEEEVEEEPEEIQPRTRSIFPPASDETWDHEKELAMRDTNHPYVISYEEFAANDNQHDQLSMTFYVQDDTLADDNDQPVDDIDGTVGEDNLDRFGDGSQDPNVVYVRNEQRGMDVEIIRSPGSYLHEVHGLQHSDEPDRRPRKFRVGDDG